MKYTATAVLLGSLLVLSVARGSRPGLCQYGLQGAEPPKPREIKEIADYQKWTLVNPQPYYVPAPRAVQCAANSNGPHVGKFIKVYVNAIGQKAMLTQKMPQFAPGSVIVKEKFLKQDSKTPELLTVMVKRKAGYDPHKGDWEYLLVDGQPEDDNNRGKLSYCQSCHVPQQAQGYIFRTYLPDEVRQKLH